MSISCITLGVTHGKKVTDPYLNSLWNCYVDLCDRVGEVVQVADHVVNLMESTSRRVQSCALALKLTLSIFCSAKSFSSDIKSLASIPACTAGWSVFTRPESISGALVMVEISSIAKPASLIMRAVPPEASILTDLSWSPFARSRSPVLSNTEMMAGHGQ